MNNDYLVLGSDWGFRIGEPPKPVCNLFQKSRWDPDKLEWVISNDSYFSR